MFVPGRLLCVFVFLGLLLTGSHYSTSPSSPFRQAHHHKGGGDSDAGL